MKRNLSVLTDKQYDLVIIGGGIFGICAAWDATLRGLTVALVERGDFAGATTANCFRIVHGGFRYLQHADLTRIRESSRERNILLRIAPHLVYPLPIVVPTYGHGIHGKRLLSAGKLIYDLITFDRNRGIRDSRRRIPRGGTISREDCLSLFPSLKREGLTGAVIFYDAQMYSPVRIALSYLKSAFEVGAVATNYAEVTGFLCDSHKVVGVEVLDVLSGDRFRIRGKVVVNAAGPWAERLLNLRKGLKVNPEVSYSRDAFIMIDRRLNASYALAIQGLTQDRDSILSRGSRHLFIAPWHEYTIIGTWHRVYRGEPDKFTVTENDLRGFLDEINEIYPLLSLHIKNITMWNAGLVLFGNDIAGVSDFSFGKRSRIIDHAKEHNIEGMITLIGVRYTTSRGVAEKVIDLVFNKLGKKPPRSFTSATPIYGGDIDCFEDFLEQTSMKLSRALGVDIIRSLLHNHGSEYHRILKYIDEDAALGKTLGTSKVIKAEVVHAIHEEMAQKLGDIVFRRTDLGTGGHPGESEINICAELMAKELGWNDTRLKKEIDEVNSFFPKF